MRPSVSELQTFYNSPSGAAVKSMVMRRLEALWPPDSGAHCILGLGYTAPFLEDYRGRAHKILQAQPAAMGVARVLSKRGNMACLVEEACLPFQPATFDRALLVHALEDSDHLPSLLSELWRVLTPEGRAVIIVTNRSGLWARSDASPFGHGRPFSRAQLSKFMLAAKLEPLAWSGALYVPPRKFLMGRRTISGFEKFGETVWPRFSGLTLVEGVKRLYADRPNGTKEKVWTPGLAGAKVNPAGHAYGDGRNKVQNREKS